MTVDDHERVSRPAWWATALVGLAVVPLPAGATRDRYHAEFGADLWGMTRGEQARYCLSVVSHALSLRAVVHAGERGARAEATDIVIRSRRPLRCRLNIHHSWHTESTEDGTRYARCRRCGKDATGSVGQSNNGDIRAAAATLWGMGNGGG